MKLRNKQTGEIYDFKITPDYDDVMSGWKIENKDFGVRYYSHLAELNEEWEDMPEEEWRDVLGFEELYQVSNFGNVRTIKNGEAEMSQQENRNGYMTVHLRNKGVERRVMVHRLVAEAFIPNPDELRDVNHKNGDKSDNRVENLEWASHSDNMTHSFRKLGKNVRHIVQLDLDNNFIERWNSIIEASEATGICRTDIGECCRGNRKHTKGYKWKYEEDYEEPKEIWTITTFGEVQGGSPEEDIIPVDPRLIDKLKEIGNYFDTREEAEKAVEKLKAWKRLKEKGFRFCSWFYDIENQEIKIKAEFKEFEEVIVGQKRQDLDLLFGGEDE